MYTQVLMSEMEAEGAGGAPKRTEHSIAFWRKLADEALKDRRYNQCARNAMYQLGWRYAKGKDLPKDLTLAKKYLELPAEWGYEPAREELAEVKRELNE